MTVTRHALQLQAIAKSVAGQPRPLSDLDGLLDKPLVTKVMPVTGCSHFIASMASANELQMDTETCCAAVL